MPALRDVLRGKADVLAFPTNRLREYWRGFRWTRAPIDGGSGFILENRGFVTASVSSGYDAAGKATDIFIMGNPDKLLGLDKGG